MFSGNPESSFASSKLPSHIFDLADMFMLLNSDVKFSSMFSDSLSFETMPLRSDVQLETL